MPGPFGTRHLTSLRDPCIQPQWPEILIEAGAESARSFLHVAVFVVHDDDYLVFGSKPDDAITFDARTFDIPARSMHENPVAQYVY